MAVESTGEVSIGAAILETIVPQPSARISSSASAVPFDEVDMDSTLPGAIPSPENTSREASAEEILEASIHFQRNVLGESRDVSLDLYPSMEQLRQSEQVINGSNAAMVLTASDISSEAMADAEPGIIMSAHGHAINDGGHVYAVATFDDEIIPQAASAAAVVVEAHGDDDPGIRKAMEEERLVSRAMMESIAFPRLSDVAAVAVSEATLEASSGDSSASVMAEAMTEGAEDEEVMKPAAIAVATAVVGVHEEEEAMVVVDIADDFHPGEFEGNSATAEFIGEDYSRTVEPETKVAAATVTAEIDTEIFEEATVLDSKPSALPSTGWDVSSSEATVLGTKPQPEIYRRPAEELEEIAVTGVDEAEATVVDIMEHVHPSEIHDDGVRAELIGRDFSRTVSSPHNQTPRPEQETMATRAISSPAAYTYHTNPFDDDPNETPAMSRDALAALDAAESPAWMYQPISVMDDVSHFVLPAPIDFSPAGPNRTDPIAPMAVAQFVGDSEVPMLPSLTTARREWSIASSGGTSIQGADSDASPRPNGANRNSSQGSTSSERRATNILSTAASTAARNTNIVMERLFGDTKGTASKRKANPNYDMENAAGSILPRTLLPWSVFPSETTGMWVATVNTNQKALDSDEGAEESKALRAFSVPTKRQAEALALAWAPPRMLTFVDNPKCFVCEAKFAVFRRPCHCRNCGVCICSGCAVQWPSKMIPDTYNIKAVSTVNACKSCDWLCSAFRLALLEGQHDQAVALHATGNVNLITPFANVKGELFYPVHCAVLGGSLALLTWLVDEHCCPLRSIRIGGKTRDSNGTVTSMLTSRGRSLLGIAMEKENVDLIRYLVVDKSMPLSGERELSMERMISILDRVLRLIPVNHSNDEILTEEPAYATIPLSSLANMPGVAPPFREEICDNSEREETAVSDDMDDHNSSGSMGEDVCIICYDNVIDCVITPCGHQICCIQCSANFSKCPACSVQCSSIRVYKP